MSAPSTLVDEIPDAHALGRLSSRRQSGHRYRAPTHDTRDASTHRTNTRARELASPRSVPTPSRRPPRSSRRAPSDTPDSLPRRTQNGQHTRGNSHERACVQSPRRTDRLEEEDARGGRRKSADSNAAGRAGTRHPPGRQPERTNDAIATSYRHAKQRDTKSPPKTGSFA